MSQYKSLSRAQLSYDYLHTNSTTHEFLFGALAELLDNARDASATKINIYTVNDSTLRGGYMLNFLDDGQGMSSDEAFDIVTFGKSTKKCLDSQLIGMYGNGLKSGSMRIGNDLIVFTKKGPVMTCVFLSRSFHEAEHIDEIIVPMPCFDSQTRKPLAKTPKEKEKHQMEMGLILKYSPFKTEAQFMKEFDKLEGDSGTLVIIYNMKLLDSGDPELDIRTDPFDILLSNPDTGEFDSDLGLMPERRSFRAYTSILFVDPRMRVYIQGKKVRTKRLANGLYKPHMYRYSSARFKTRSENEAKRAQDESKIAENRAKEAESKARNLEMKYGSATDKEHRAELRRSQATAAELMKDAQIKKQIAERKAKALRDPKSLVFVFGINIDSRSQDGMFIYNCSRLIKMYQKVGPQVDGGVFCSGVVGFVDVPYLVLEPTHNKQDFADAKEYRHLLQAMGEHMLQYWKDIGIAQQGVTKFWEGFGYINPSWRDPPSTDQKFIRKRAMQVQVTLQCDLCLKWRILPFSSNNIGKIFPDDWVCSMNPDPAHNRCSAAEEKLNMPEGVLKKVVKTKEEKQHELEEEIKKKQERLEKLTVTGNSTGLKGPPMSKPSFTQKPGPASFKSSLRKSVSDDEDNEDDDDVDSDEDDRLKKKTPSKPASAVPSRSSKRTAAAASSDEDDDDWRGRSARSAAKRRRSATKHNKIVRNVSSDEASEDDEQVVEPDDGLPVVAADAGNIGDRVEIKFQNTWQQGTITGANDANTKWKVRLDDQKTEKWFDRKNSNVRLVKESKLRQPSINSNNSKATPSTDSKKLTAVANVSTSRLPDASTVAETRPSSSAPNPQIVDDIANGYRTCLRYFLPPQWVMDKDSVSGLSLEELSSFPLEDFFDHYEKGLKRLVSSFQLDAQNRLAESEQTKQKLSSLRKMIARLLKSINDDCDIDQETDTDRVDELLELCVRQALPQADGDGDASSASAS